MCVTEGAGPLLWLCVLPSGARQIFEERILPEGQCQTAGGLNTENLSMNKDPAHNALC